MKSLNNKGWGTKEMIILSCGLLLVLLFVAISIYRLYHSGAIVAPQYAILEKTLENESKNYAASNGKKPVITLKQLQESGFIDLFTDINDKPCDGYVLVSDNKYIPYISCQYYRTNGYDEKYKD